MGTARLPSDASLELLLRETRWGDGGVAARITGSPDPARYRALWAGLTVYRQASIDWRNRYDQALSAAAGRGVSNIFAQSVIQAKHEMMQAPADFPFCLGPVQWREHCQSLWGGLVDSTDYRPRSALADTAALVAKALFGVGVAAVAAQLLPEEVLVGSALAAMGGTAAAKALLNAGATAVAEHFLPGSNPLDDIAKATLWRRYQLESRRRKVT